MQAALDRPRGDAEDDGDLNDVEILGVPQRQQFLPVRRQSPEGLRDRMAGSFLGRVVIGPWPLVQYAGEIPLPAGIEIPSELNFTVLTISSPRVEEEVEVEEELEEELADEEEVETDAAEDENT